MMLRLLNKMVHLLFSKKGEQYIVHCPQMAPRLEGPSHVDEVMETGSGACEEEVLLDS